MTNILTGFSVIYKTTDGNLTVNNPTDSFMCIERIWSSQNDSIKITEYTDQNGIKITSAIVVKSNEATLLIIPPKQEIKATVVTSREYIFMGHYFDKDGSIPEPPVPIKLIKKISRDRDNGDYPAGTFETDREEKDCYYKFLKLGESPVKLFLVQENPNVDPPYNSRGSKPDFGGKFIAEESIIPIKANKKYYFSTDKPGTEFVFERHS